MEPVANTLLGDYFCVDNLWTLPVCLLQTYIRPSLSMPALRVVCCLCVLLVGASWIVLFGLLCW